MCQFTPAAFVIMNMTEGEREGERERKRDDEGKKECRPGTGGKYQRPRRRRLET